MELNPSESASNRHSASSPKDFQHIFMLSPRMVLNWRFFFLSWLTVLKKRCYRSQLGLFPRFCAVAFWGNNRRKTQLWDQFSRLIAFICPVHDHSAWLRSLPQRRQQLAAFRRISSLAGRKRKNHGAFIRCGNCMQFCCPSAAGFTNSLSAVFLMP